MILLVDNYDSFTHNLRHRLAELGETDVQVVRNDAITVAQVEQLAPKALVISPGPSTPAEAGISMALIEAMTGKIPILGVCLGMQAMAAVAKASVERAPQAIHGKQWPVFHQQEGLFSGLSSPTLEVRYHSLVVNREEMAQTPYEITAWTEDGLVMGIRHRKFPQVQGVQFHPESHLSQGGMKLLANFLQGLVAPAAHGHHRGV